MTVPTEGKLLYVSGVSIAADPPGLGIETPCPEYIMVREALDPDVVDVKTIVESPNPIIRYIATHTSPHWAVALATNLPGHTRSAVLATGEDVGLPSALLASIFRPRRPLLMVCHNISTRRPSFFLKRLKAGSRVTRFLCLSSAQADILVQRYGIPKDRTQVIYGHVDHEFFRPNANVPIRNQICSAGVAQRDYRTLVEATRGLDIDVKIAADSPYLGPTSVEIADTSLPNRVEARSYRTYRALRDLYAESRFVVVPLFDVNFSAGYSVILEAMAMGKAVIVSRIKQKDDFVVDGWNGFYVTPGSVDELRDRVQFLLDRPDDAERMGLNGRRRVEDCFTLAAYLRRLEGALGEVGANPI